MNEDFFLTHHSAQLMEDLVQDLHSGAPLFLLYGESGIGKTRLLRELREIGLAGRDVHWLDFGEGVEDDDSRQDRSEEVEKLFDKAAGRDIVIVDHFEKALQRTRHQLFVSWSTVGRQKQIGMIVASHDELLDEFIQLSEQYQVDMGSTRQLPFNKAETSEFLASYLFPDHLSGEVTMPTQLARQLSGIRGNPGALIDFAERQGKHVGIATPMVGASMGAGRLLPAVLAVLVLVGGIAWYLFGQAPGTGATIAGGDVDRNAPAADIREPVAGAPADNASAGPGDTDPQAAPLAPAAVIIPEVVPEPVIATAAESLPEAEPEAEIAAAPAPAEIVEAETVTAAVTESGADTLEASADTVTDGVAIEAAMVDAATENESLARDDGRLADAALSEDVFPEPTPSPPPVSWDELYPEEPVVANQAAPRSRFESDLERSMAWISQREDRVGTIQILLLSQDKFDEQNYYDYLAGLSAQQVDPEEVRVFGTYTGNAEVYSVVYGEYESRAAALRAIGQLPPVLRDSGPLARSVGGLWQEIRRLESKN